MLWMDGKPVKAGYYLAAWWDVQADMYRVRELWFNPESSPGITHDWWTTRGYFQERGFALAVDVVAWTQIPEYTG